nr:hypothetical protein [Pseudodesulfovibrio cashew]
MPHPYEYQLKRDHEGRIIEKTETVAGKSVVWTYAYDKVGRLTEARLGNRIICQCWYDREGRRNQDCFPATAGKDLRRYTYRLDNRLMSAGNNGYTHDKNGFRSIWKHEGKYTTYQYAPDCRLLRAEKEDEGVVFEFAHDGEGRREAKFRNGELVEAYAWLDFLRLAGFHDGEHGHEFAYRENERTPYAMRRDDGAVAALLYDQVGSLRVVADMDGQNHYDTFTSRWAAPDPMGDAGWGVCRQPDGSVQPLAHADAVFHGKAVGLVERAHGFVARHDLEVNLDAAQGRKALLGVGEQGGADPMAAPVRGCCQGVYPAPVAVVSRHDRADYLAAVLGHEEEVVHGDFLVDGQGRGVVGGLVAEHVFPEGDDRLPVR